MIEIHQAIFGQGRDPGHSLLKSSYDKDTIANQLSGYTDLVDRPLNGTLSKPIVRGFIIKEHFLLIKYFPDFKGRPGRVFSHAIIIKKEDYLRVKDISDLLHYHLSIIDKHFDPKVIHYENNPETTSIHLDNRTSNATNALINHIDNNNAIVWIGETGYWNWISNIWPQLPDLVKENIKLGNAFNAKHLNRTNLNLLIIPEEIKANWIREGCAIIDDTKPVSVDSSLQKYLLGVDKAKDKLDKLLTALKPKITEIDDLRIFNKYATLYASLTEDHPFKDFLFLADVISKFNPDQKSAVPQKKEIIDVLASLVLKATPEEFYFLQHQTWVGYEAEYINSKMGNAITKWLEQNLFREGTSKIAVSAINIGQKNLWHNTVITYIKSTLKLWKSSYKEIIWEWIGTNGEAIKKIILLLPDEAEADLVASLPKLDKKIGDVILSVAEEIRWTYLLGMLAINILPSKKAFEKVLTIKKVTLDLAILEKMANKISAQQFLSDASAIDDDRLITLAVKMLKSKPSLKQQSDFTNLGWQKIWGKSAQQGLDVWAGINKPKDYLYQMMDLIIEGQVYDKLLLKEISESNYNSLKDYDKRTTIWLLLPVDCRLSFLIATLIECLVDIDAKKISLKDIDQPLVECLDSREVINFMISNPNISTETKLDLIQHLKNFTEQDTILFIESNTFNKETSARLGKMVFSNDWKKVTNYIYSITDRRTDLNIALQNCLKLLNFWERLFLTKSGNNIKIVSQEEAWNALYQKVTKLYPDGPNNNGLWERSGGQKADLHHQGSGKQIWQNALSHIKNGGSPKPKDLLKRMIEDFPFDDSLKQFKHII